MSPLIILGILCHLVLQVPRSELLQSNQDGSLFSHMRTIYKSGLCRANLSLKILFALRNKILISRGHISSKYFHYVVMLLMESGCFLRLANRSLNCLIISDGYQLLCCLTLTIRSLNRLIRSDDSSSKYL